MTGLVVPINFVELILEMEDWLIIFRIIRQKIQNCDHNVQSVWSVCFDKLIMNTIGKGILFKKWLKGKFEKINKTEK